MHSPDGRSRPKHTERCLRRDHESALRSGIRGRLDASEPKGVSRMTPRIARTAQIAALVLALALVPVAFAAKGGGKPGGGGTAGGTAGGTISLHLLSSTDGLAHVGQKVTFDVSTTATQYPWVIVDCYDASGAWVYHASNGIFATSLSQVFTLASNTWMSGDADCTAWLQNWDNSAKHHTITNLASTKFHVYA